MPGCSYATVVNPNEVADAMQHAKQMKFRGERIRISYCSPSPRPSFPDIAIEGTMRRLCRTQPLGTVSVPMGRDRRQHEPFQTPKKEENSSGSGKNEQISMASSKEWSSNTEGDYTWEQPDLENPSEEGRRLFLKHFRRTMYNHEVKEIFKPYAVRCSTLLFATSI
jgi:hypothetical protein